MPLIFKRPLLRAVRVPRYLQRDAGRVCDLKMVGLVLEQHRRPCRIDGQTQKYIFKPLCLGSIFIINTEYLQSLDIHLFVDERHDACGAHRSDKFLVITELLMIARYKVNSFWSRKPLQRRNKLIRIRCAGAIAQIAPDKDDIGRKCLYFLHDVTRKRCSVYLSQVQVAHPECLQLPPILLGDAAGAPLFLL